MCTVLGDDVSGGWSDDQDIRMPYFKVLGRYAAFHT